ncbi:putative mitochondrial ribosomal protein of the small subunit [Papiliotrema laurentii]|jgi:ribosomal protein S8|uniref:Mitochondrial ribosomal protein of the small subunit n=1 Tax=Papiliotrema laurentii TaxID=5418 RepID=A0AAD9CRJ7_PAPLA|nr:putative mitochondrial ribosomal protein of the small subunit [Papiliotrema laurentii]
MSHGLTTIPHKLCSHLQNVSRGAIARTPLPYTTANLAISTILLRHGLISNLTLGDPQQPNPSAFHSAAALQRRIWVDMKYRNGLPVLRNMSLISKPSFRVYVTRDELGRILHGKRARNVGGVGMGEILIVKTENDRSRGRTGRDTYMDGWEAWRAGLGGELLLRAA